ncbi:GntP family permease [Saccharicrinis aurantiacus]|uniref:GntP family permease n=1 Tax=Saccharicrinis aurantiacus TaxID=1849719 RepID=UPI00094FDF16|nr:gluconate:H+ symporter [Saccharicrinis aurantiacus]
MIDYILLISVLTGVGALLLMILYFKIQPFMALLISSIIVGIIAGVAPMQIIATIKEGMGSTLGFVAVVVGLGSMFGAILEYSGGAEALAGFLLSKFGEKRADWALVLTGFFIAIPVFFDVAFIILVPLVYSLQRKTKKSLLLYAIPLLAGLAITHAFIPPTPGPIAVADILDADLGWVILFGFIVGIPTAMVCGPIFGKYIASKIYIEAPSESASEERKDFPPIGLILLIIASPIVLIVLNTMLNSSLSDGLGISANAKLWISFIGHPFSALIIANILAWYFLGLRRGFSKSELSKITQASLGPAGIIILLTGAGGVFKQMLIHTGTGEMLAQYFASIGLSSLMFAFVAAALVRILQGSSTVAMITAAGITSSLLIEPMGEMYKALLVIAIAAGASIMSHVNDSGFWLVSKYLGMNEKQAFKSWTVMTTILAFMGISMVGILSIFIID